MTDYRVVRAAAERLSNVVEAEGFSGWDPYDALASPLLGKVAKVGVLRQLAIQALKAMPVNARPLLGVPQEEHTKALALFVSSYARLAPLQGGDRYLQLALELARRLRERGIPAGGGTGWGYEFDVQTRWAYYRRGQPNSVVSAFAAHAFLDLADVTGDETWREPVAQMLEFARSDLFIETPRGAFFSYFGGSKTPVHNANVLAASVFARYGELDSFARRALEYSLAHQRADGSWPYAEGRGLGWVDGYHTAYVLRGLAWADRAEGAPPVRGPIVRGLDLYLRKLIDPDGAPRSTLRFRYPLDIHSAASAIWALTELREYDARAIANAGLVLNWTLASMRREDGRFIFQRRRFLRNSLPYVRWSDGHMLLALTTYLRAVEKP